MIEALATAMLLGMCIGGVLAFIVTVRLERRYMRTAAWRDGFETGKEYGKMEQQVESSVQGTNIPDDSRP